MSIELYELRQKQSLPLAAKITMSKRRIIDWYDYWDGMVYASVSGGIDSTVMYHLIRQVYSDVPGFFVNTRMEFPEIVSFVRTLPDVTFITPKKTPAEVFQQYGYPVVSKEISRSAYYARKGSQWALMRFEGKRPDGTPSQWYAERHAKWKYLLDAGFPISDACCKELKLEPLKEIEKLRKPYIGMLASESERRTSAYLKTGCNIYDNRKPRSMPLGFWTQQDILRYIVEYDVPYAREIYGEIVEDANGKLHTTLEQRTGCYACPLGQSRRRKKGTETRYQRLKRLHPKQYEYAMKPLEEGGLGLSPVLDALGIPY